MRPHRSAVPIFFMLSVASGILVQRVLVDHAVYRKYLLLAAVIAFISFGGFCLANVSSFRVRRKLRNLLWFLGSIGMMTISFLNAQLTTADVEADLIKEIAKSDIQVLVVHSRPRYSDPGMFRMQIMGTNKTSSNSAFQPVLAELKVERGSDIQIGDTLLHNGQLRTFDRTVNPGQFDYGSYMKKKKVYFKGRLQKRDFLVIRSNDPAVSPRIHQWRWELLSSIEEYTIDRRDASLLQALLLGEKSTLDEHIKAAFRDSGTSHLLAVSGMHVGLVYLLMFLVIGEIRFLGITGKQIDLSLIPLIWLYALLSGFGPSVLRAVLLITFVQLVRLTGRKVRPSNVLFSCVMLLLIAHPGLMFELGFQLSVLATIGIMVFALPVVRSISSLPKWCRIPLQLCVVSLAAQIMVLPLTLFHFNQIQLHFLISNLLLTPLVTLVMYAGIALMVLGPVPILGELLARLLSWLSAALLWTADRLASMDGYILNDIPFKRDWVLASLILSLGVVVIIELFSGREVILKVLQWTLLEWIGTSYMQKEMKTTPNLLRVELEEGHVTYMICHHQVYWLDGIRPNQSQFFEATSKYWLQNGQKPRQVFASIKYLNCSKTMGSTQITSQKCH